MELEIELFAGELQPMLDLGKTLREKYGLVPEDQSKLAQGLDLIRNVPKDFARR